jgi:hypothetical protein
MGSCSNFIPNKGIAMKNKQMYLKVASSVLAILSLGVLAGCVYEPYAGGYYAGSPYYSHCGAPVVTCGHCCGNCCSGPYGYATAYPYYAYPYSYYSYSYYPFTYYGDGYGW